MMRRLWTPLAGTNLICWFRADDASAFTFSSSNNVSQWNDESGNGHNLTQATAGLDPQRSTTAFNNFPAVVFTESVGTYLATSAFSRSAPFTVFFAGYSTSPSRDHQYVSDSNTSNNASVQFRSTGALNIYAGSFLASTTTNSNIPRAYACVFNGASSVIRDGSTETTGNPGTASLNGLTLGDPGGGGVGFGLIGPIAELWVTSDAKSSTDRQIGVDYLRAKYQIPLKPCSFPMS